MPESALAKVELEGDVYMACLNHALSTENFEVMGLLIGNLVDGVAKISALQIMQRSDKKKDRVEISSEQLLSASLEAERLTMDLGRPMRVLGWYHSHPHITVWPSHVDVRTQATYQTMDPGFVGLIFSVFSQDKETKEQEILVTCFQSLRGEATEIPLKIVPTKNVTPMCFKTMLKLPKILIKEEEEMAQMCSPHPDILESIQNTAVEIRALAHITDVVTRPLVISLIDRCDLNKKRVKFLHKLVKELQEELGSC